MTPPRGASHADQSGTLTLGRSTGDWVAGAAARLIEPRNWAQFCLLVDLVILYLASTIALFGSPASGGVASGWLAAIFPLPILAMMHFRRSPDERMQGSSLDTATHVVSVVSVATTLTIAVGSVIGGAHPLSLALRLWLFGGVYLALARIVLLSIRRQALRTAELSTPTLILGAGLVGELLVKRLTTNRNYGLRPVGFIDSDPMPASRYGAAGAVPVLGGPDDLAEAIRQTGARRVILAFSSEPDRVLVEKVRECEQLGVEVSLVPRMFEAISEHAVLDHLGGLPLISLHPTDPRGWQFAIKHALDRCLALIALIALSPVIGAIALAVRLSSPGPILFRQRRVGRDGRVFDVLKFRTMRLPAPGSYDAFVLPDGCAPGGIEGEDRRTLLGRWLRGTSLDEVPQLINVLRGEMSIVGPRPERPEFAARFGAEVNRYDDRLRVKSGITGWAQVNGLRGQTSIADRVEWDNYYIRNWSLGFDLKIMLLTVGEILRLRDSQKARKHAADTAR